MPAFVAATGEVLVNSCDRRRVCCGVVAALWLCGVVVTGAASRAEAELLDLYIMAGQSNSWGGALASSLPEPWQQPRPEVWYNGMLQDKSIPGPELAEWRALGPREDDGKLRYGPEVPFGWQLPDNSAIFHFSVSGSNLQQNWRDEYLDQMFEALDLAIADLASMGHTVRFAGMTWNQGEGDATKENFAQAYADNLTWLIDEVRTYTDEPELPFTFARLHINNFQAPYRQVVRDAQQWVTENIPDTWLINADDVPLRWDWVHYQNPDGWLMMGPRYAGPFVNPADLDVDGDVDLDDYNILSGHYGQLGTWDQGDIDGSGRIDFSDFVEFALAFEAGAGESLSALPGVPEPTAAALLLAAGGVLVRRRRCPTG